MGFLDGVFGRKRTKRVQVVAAPAPKRRRTQPTIEGEAIKYLRKLERTNPAAYDRAMDQIVARQFRLDSDDPAQPKSFREQLRDVKELARELGFGGKNSESEDDTVQIVKELANSKLAEGFAAFFAPKLAQLGKALPGPDANQSQATAPKAILGEAPSLSVADDPKASVEIPIAASVTSRRLIAMLADEPASAAATMFHEAAKSDPSTWGPFVDLLCQTSDDAIPAFLDQVAKQYPPYADFVAWARPQDPWLRAIIHQLRALRATAGDSSNGLAS